MKKVLKKRDSRKRILKAALNEIRLKGFQSANINIIAKKSGLTKGALYYYFKNKRELGYAVVDMLKQDMLHDVWIQPLETCNDPISCIQSIINNDSEQMTIKEIRLGSPLIDLAVEMTPLDKAFRQRFDLIRETWLESITDSLERGKQQKVVNSRVDSHKIAIHLLAFLMGSRALAKGAQSLELFLDCQARLIEFLESLRS